MAFTPDRRFLPDSLKVDKQRFQRRSGQPVRLQYQLLLRSKHDEAKTESGQGRPLFEAIPQVVTVVVDMATFSGSTNWPCR